mmetsp:Transcript_43384/g.48830  ORF Transcript_43384/g.48830 Transcript_43384/m.48830 type:complete len:531 (+) Transcript_43384:149-1741(+)
MVSSDAEETDGDDHDNKTMLLETEQKKKTFRKRRLSLTNLRQCDSDNEDEEEDDQSSIVKEKSESVCQYSEKHQDHDDHDNGEKAHSFRKRRLSLTSHNNEDTTSVASASNEQNNSPPSCSKRHRKTSDASASSLGSTNAASSTTCSHLKSRTLHSAELLAQPPSSPSIINNSVLLPKLYQQAAPPQQKLSLIDDDDDESKQKTPKWKTRYTRQHPDDDLPFPRDVVGTYSCHGVEPIYDDGSVFQPSEDKLTMAAKTNQDRGGVAFPYGNSSRTALFAVYDGHGQGGELVSQYSLHEIQRLLEKHPDFSRNTENAFKETFLKVDSSLKDECLIEPFYAGTTACVALLRDKKLVLSNAGDSRAVIARKKLEDGRDDDGNSWEVIELTEDQNPDLPAEQARIERMGGYVSPPPEPGLSSRVWLDKEWSQIGLAMARSIGDHAVKPIGVIAEPVVSFHDVNENDSFLILATDGVWEFISSAEAVEIVAMNLHKGATKACQILIEAAAAKWHDEEGDYRDDITALVIRLQNLW